MRLFLINAPPKGIANELARVANDLYTFSDGVVYCVYCACAEDTKP